MNNFNVPGEENNVNLLNGSICLDDLQKKNKNDDSFSDNNNDKMEDILKNNFGNYPTTDTNNYFELFANNRKMIPEEDVYYFDRNKPNDNDKNNLDAHNNDIQNDKNDNNHISNGNEKDYHDNYNNNKYQDDDHKTPLNDGYERNNFEHENKPIPSHAGPSYGCGESYPSNNFHQSEFNSKEDESLAKLDILRKLGELTQYGVKLSQNYNMDSDYKAMKYEYELHKNIREKHNGVKWLSNLLCNITWGIELANEKLNPFDFKLKGWSEQINDDIDSYHEVLGDLYEKYFKSGKSVPPELKLAFLLSTSAVKFHATNATLNSIPNVKDFFSKDNAMKEKIKKQSSFGKTDKRQQEHDEAYKKAVDLHNLNEQEKEYKMYIQQQLEKQKNMQQSRSNEVYNQPHNNTRDIQQVPKDNSDKNNDLDHKSVLDELAQQRAFQEKTNNYFKQELLEKQKQLEELQKQLNLQRSDTKSTMSIKSSNKNDIGQQKSMIPPKIPNSLKKNPKVIQHKTNNFKKSKININPEIDNIIENKLIESIHESDVSSITSSYSNTPISHNKKTKIVVQTK